ncbi:vacuolar DHA amino acid exporter [Fomes fomentarius]|nr:vacuolar DHA amino acid exporter [Fomes fomentarius]
MSSGKPDPQEPEGDVRSAPSYPPNSAIPDIEHVSVTNDPRSWSKARKWSVVAIVSAASLIAGLNGNIYNPAIPDIQQELRASNGAIALSLSLYCVFQGGVPLIWSALSEFWGRKNVYLLATALSMVGCIVAALSKTIVVLVAMRCIQAIGASAVLTLGAATLADIYDPAERGTMMGIYYRRAPIYPCSPPPHLPLAPVLGPSLGPIVGGALTQAFNWRATFWFLAIFIGICILAFVFFKDTFRRERSLTYQAALRRRRAQMSAKESESSSVTQLAAVPPPPSTHSEPALSKSIMHDDYIRVLPATDVEKQQEPPRGDGTTAVVAPLDDIKLTLADVNPAKPIMKVLRRTNNVIILIASGFTYGFIYCISYTCTLTLSNKYGYDSMLIGLVLLSFGIGSLLGSLFGGRYSDYVFAKLKARNGGVGYPEMRLRSTIPFMPFLPASVVAYGWVCQEHVHIAAVCATLFLSSFFVVCIYTSTLAYIVDANPGRSSSAVAMNSAFRNLAAFVGAEVAVPLQNAIGDGGSYTLWGGLMLLSEVLMLLVWCKGAAWRDKWEVRERGVSRPA